MTSRDALNQAFSSHPRQWREFRYVYPVIARRSRGLSIGINLNPRGDCSFDCVYCCVDRGHLHPGGTFVLTELTRELRHMLDLGPRVFEEPEFRAIPVEFRRLNDFAFSGDGEPTNAPEFPAAVQLVADLRRAYGLSEVKIVLITNATGLTRPAVVAALATLDANGGEIWAKLDAGTEEHYHRFNRSRVPFARVLDNLLATARVRPIVIQSLFARWHGAPPAAEEVAAYVDRLRALQQGGGQLARVQIYTIARQTAEDYVAPLATTELEPIAAAVRALGVSVEVFP